MAVSLKLTQFTGGHEGKVLTWYLDPTGTPTIGYGFTWASTVFRNWWTAKYNRQMRRGDTMTEREALEVLKLVLEHEAAPPVDRLMPGAKVNVREAAYDMVFNAGAGSLKWKWAVALMKGDLVTGAALLKTTATTSKGRRLPGLVRRRAEEADIAQFGKYPDWVSTSPITTSTAPETHVYAEDIKQAQLWLESLGYSPGPADGVPGQRTVAAVTRFQRDHGTLKVDGKIGPATLDALQRTIDLRKKLGGVAATGGGATAGGIAGEAGAVDGVPVEHVHGIADAVAPWLIWGGVAVLIVGVVYLAWKYQDEINAILRRL